MIYKSIYLARRNPSVVPEDWPRTWRSHPRAVAKMGSVGASISAAIGTINYCARLRAPILNGVPFEPPGVSEEHDGVAIVSSTSEELHRINSEGRAGQEAVIEDELRVFGRPVEQFSMACHEVVSLGGPPGQAVVVRFLMRKPALTQEQFLARWTGPHTDLVRAAAATGTVSRYAQNTVVRKAPPGYAFDGIDETWFRNVEDAVRSFVDPKLTALSGDLTDFCDIARGVTMLTEVIYRLPRE
jgi:hypothetical protein